MRITCCLIAALPCLLALTETAVIACLNAPRHARAGVPVGSPPFEKDDDGPGREFLVMDDNSRDTDLLVNIDELKRLIT